MSHADCNNDVCQERMRSCACPFYVLLNTAYSVGCLRLLAGANFSLNTVLKLDAFVRKIAKSLTGPWYVLSGVHAPPSAVHALLVLYCGDSSVGWLPMYWSLDKGYLHVVYLFNVAYLQYWNWPFVFSTAKQP